MNPRTKKTIPTAANGPAASEGTRAALMLLDRSDALGVDDDDEIESNDHIMTTAVSTKQTAAKESAATPTQIIQLVARVRGSGVDAIPDW